MHASIKHKTNELDLERNNKNEWMDKYLFIYSVYFKLIWYQFIYHQFYRASGSGRWTKSFNMWLFLIRLSTRLTPTLNPMEDEWIYSRHKHSERNKTCDYWLLLICAVMVVAVDLLLSFHRQIKKRSGKTLSFFQVDHGNYPRILEWLNPLPKLHVSWFRANYILVTHDASYVYLGFESVFNLDERRTSHWKWIYSTKGILRDFVK